MPDTPKNEQSQDEPELGHISFGEPGFYEDWLVGDRTGFESLRDHIDELLENGADVGFSSDSFSPDMLGLTLNEKNECALSAQDTGYDWLYTVGCSIFLLIIGFIFILGIVKVSDLFF